MNDQHDCAKPGTMQITFNASIAGVLSAECTASCTAPRAASICAEKGDDVTKGEVRMCWNSSYRCRIISRIYCEQDGIEISWNEAADLHGKAGRLFSREPRSACAPDFDVEMPIPTPRSTEALARRQ
jgi:hypothetical protein